ncbi:MAG: hypothetical protein IT537_11190 [Hyphomicrobiales bacterium]|nr:hypothetical protein [Hyphomicrobiales bacterium]
MQIIAAVLALVLAVAVVPHEAAAEDYPNRAVRVLIPFTPGGAPDVLLRLVAQHLQDKWRQTVVVENRAGGNTLVGTVAAAKSAPDGYTLLLAADQTFVLNPLLYASLPYSMQELAADVAEILARREVKTALEARGFVIDTAGPDAFEKYIADETVKWEKVIKQASIKGD